MTWNVWCNDSAGNSAWNATNYTVRVETQNPTIEFAGGTEDNNTYFNRNWIYVNVRAFDENEANITFYLYNSSYDNVPSHIHFPLSIIYNIKDNHQSILLLFHPIRISSV